MVSLTVVLSPMGHTMTLAFTGTYRRLVCYSSSKSVQVVLRQATLITASCPMALEKVSLVISLMVIDSMLLYIRVELCMPRWMQHA